MADEIDDSEVGYRKPTNSGQFPKGTSGNPKGRPKGSKNMKTTILRESRRLVRVNGPHGARMVTTFEAACMQLGNKSAQGNLHATKEFFAQLRWAEEGTTAQTGSEDMPEADQKMMQSILKQIEELTSNQKTSPEEDQ